MLFFYRSFCSYIRFRAHIDIVLVDSFKFIDLDDGADRLRAMKIIEEMKGRSGYTTEPIQITGKKADDLMFKANLNLRELNSMLQKENRDTFFIIIG